MKTKTTITELTHEDLVNLFSTALYGSSYLSADWDDNLPTNEDSCYEDTIADILLAGGHVYVKDHYAEGTKFRDWASFDEDENAIYPIRMCDIIKGLEKSADGTFKAEGNWRDCAISFARQSFDAFLNERTDWDAVTADCLMQIILFDEIIYG